MILTPKAKGRDLRCTRIVADWTDTMICISGPPRLPDTSHLTIISAHFIIPIQTDASLFIRTPTAILYYSLSNQRQREEDGGREWGEHEKTKEKKVKGKDDHMEKQKQNLFTIPRLYK